MAENEQAAQRAKKEETSIVRIAGRDINGSYTIAHALLRIKGINQNLAQVMALVAERKFGISGKTAIGSLPDDKLAEVEQVIKDPLKFGIPAYMLNRRKDIATGQGHPRCGHRPHSPDEAGHRGHDKAADLRRLQAPVRPEGPRAEDEVDGQDRRDRRSHQEEDTGGAEEAGGGAGAEESVIQWETRRR